MNGSFVNGFSRARKVFGTFDERVQLENMLSVKSSSSYVRADHHAQ